MYPSVKDYRKGKAKVPSFSKDDSLFPCFAAAFGVYHRVFVSVTVCVCVCATNSLVTCVTEKYVSHFAM